MVARHPALEDQDSVRRLMAEAQTRAERLGVPELTSDVRFLGRVADEIAPAGGLLSRVDQIRSAGHNGLGKGVLDFRD